MKITLTKKESEEMFYNALCNAVGTGYMNGYGIELTYSDEDYFFAKTTLKGNGLSPCYEDVLMEILREGKSLTFTDIEGDGDNTKTITLADVHNRVPKMPINHLTDMINENDDVETADVLLQTVFFEDVIFG